jgi:hypothetical protein
VGNSYHPSAISAADAAYLQNAAWNYMKDFITADNGGKR